MDLLITFNHGIVIIENMSEEARLGLRRENDVKSLFYFYENEFKIDEDKYYYFIEGNRQGIFCVQRNKKITREMMDHYSIPTNRFKKAICTFTDIFKSEPSCYISEYRVVIPLPEIHKHVTLKIPKNITVRVNQSNWICKTEHP